MPSSNEPRRDARHCPNCDALGILPLDQPRWANGAIQNPVMVCPVWETEFRTAGMRFYAARPPRGFAALSEREATAWVRAFVDAVLEKTERTN